MKKLDKTERTILLSRLQTILNFVAWEDLQLQNLDSLKAEVDGELYKLTEEKKE